jgi:predicted dehydrogenase
LCEKPMAVDEKDCEEMAAACKKHNVLLSIGHVLRSAVVSAVIAVACSCYGHSHWSTRNVCLTRTGTLRAIAKSRS